MVPTRYGGLIGEGDFEQVGDEFLTHFRELCGLRPTDRVLDVGCGLGRMAVPLTSYLDGGSYHGFDVVRPMIDSCRRRIGTRHPNFTFDHVDVWNGKYNPGGQIRPDEFRFPYDDDSFDLVFATSLFTHMRGADVSRYLAEMDRVLQPTGALLVTWFVVTEETAELARQRRTDPALRVLDHGVWTADPREPEQALAYGEPLVRAFHADAGLAIREPIHFGRWRGTPGLSYQDIVVGGHAV